MNFTQQMLTVMEVIHIFRQYPAGSDDALRTIERLKPLPDAPKGWRRGDRRPLIELAVEERAQAMLAAKGLTVTRQSWHGCEGATKGRKVIWHGIKRAMEGLDPLPEHAEIEKQIEWFGTTDEPSALKEMVERLGEELIDKKRIIAELKDGRKQFEEEFKIKAYTEQYVYGELLEELVDFRKNYETAQAKLASAEKLRQGLDLANRRLREQVAELKTRAEGIGLAINSGAKPTPPIDHSPTIASIKKDSQSPMRDYYDLRDAAWDNLLTSAKNDAPDYVFLVFHKFNIDVQHFIISKLSPLLPAGATNVVFACYQPNASFRKSMFGEISKLSKMTPIVYVVEGTPAPESNVTPIKAEKKDIRIKLHMQVVEESTGNRPAVEPFNPVREGFRQVWIERVNDE